MTDNPTFVQALANAAQRPVEVSPVKEATTLGAAFLAGLAVGTWGGWDDIAATWRPRAVVEPNGTLDREQWAKACDRAAAWIPELSSLTLLTGAGVRSCVAGRGVGTLVGTVSRPGGRGVARPRRGRSGLRRTGCW